MQPDEGHHLRFGSKVPGSAMEVRDVNMDFLRFGVRRRFSEAYERLILDVLLGEPSLFPVNAEVELSEDPRSLHPDFWAQNGENPNRTNPAPGARFRVRDVAGTGRGNGDAHDPLERRAETAEVIVDLPDTTTNDINKKITALREEGGAITLGRVLTLVIAPDTEDLVESSIEAATSASRSTPPDHRRGTQAIGSPPSPGWTAKSGWVPTLVRARCGASHLGTAVRARPQCRAAVSLPDTPVVAWWPGASPAVPPTIRWAGWPCDESPTPQPEDPLAALRSRLTATPMAIPILPGAESRIGGFAGLRGRPAALQNRSRPPWFPPERRTCTGHPGRVVGMLDRRPGAASGRRTKVELNRPSETVVLNRPGTGSPRP